MNEPEPGPEPGARPPRRRTGRLAQTGARAAGLWVPERPALARFSDGRDVEVLLPEGVG